MLIYIVYNKTEWGMIFMDRCPYCGENMYRIDSRRIFIGFGGGPFFWVYPGWGWDYHHGWGGWGGHGGHGHRRNED